MVAVLGPKKVVAASVVPKDTLKCRGQITGHKLQGTRHCKARKRMNSDACVQSNALWEDRRTLISHLVSKALTIGFKKLDAPLPRIRCQEMRAA